MVPGYSHGWLDCSRCFKEDEDPFIYNNWELQNDPGYAGSNSPRILVLGFSKGATAIEAAKQGDYNKVPFAGMRKRLQKVLEKLEQMPNDQSIDEMLTAKEKEFGGVSLVRCSLCRRKKKGKKCLTSGAMVTAGFNLPEIYTFVRKCANAYLANPPESLEQVLVLGTIIVYIRKTKQLFRKLYPDFHHINGVAFRARNALWIYVAHPSPNNGYFESWIKAKSSNPSGEKCLMALDALGG
jgi:hypothetical protein